MLGLSKTLTLEQLHRRVLLFLHSTKADRVVEGVIA